MNHPPAKLILQTARQNGYAIGAFNAANIETLKAIIQAAVKLRSPVIIESSPGETSYIGARNLVSLVHNYQDEYQIPILVNLDHAVSEDETDIGIAAGYELIHIDGSKLEYEENIVLSKKVVDKAHGVNLLVEGEIDHIAGSSQLHSEDIVQIQEAGHYTDPEQAADFVNRTGVDTLASFIGNVHGVYPQPPQLDIERLKQIAAKVDCFLSLHGGSGIPEDQVRAAIQAGIAKVNVNTELRMAYRKALENILQTSEELAIYKLMPPVIEAIQKVVEEKIKLFGSEGKA